MDPFSLNPLHLGILQPQKFRIYPAGNRSSDAAYDPTVPKRGVYRVWGAALLLLGLYLVPVLVSFCLPDPRGDVPWRQARRDPTGLSPDPTVTQEAVIQLVAAPAQHASGGG
jgi:hypothetical protein